MIGQFSPCTFGSFDVSHVSFTPDVCWWVCANCLGLCWHHVFQYSNALRRVWSAPSVQVLLGHFPSLVFDDHMSSCHDRTTAELSLLFSKALLLVWLWSFADKTHLTQKYTVEPVPVEQMHSTDSALATVGQCCDHNLTRLISVHRRQNPRCCSQDLSTVLARLVSDQAHGSDMSWTGIPPLLTEVE